MYSPVAHELGHYLSFLAMMRNYDLESILLVDNKNVNLFYDVYLNGDNAKDASKYVVAVLKGKLEG